MQTHSINSDGLVLAVEGIGQGSPLVFAHGLTATRRNTLEQLAPLSPHYRIIAFDQRGHGASTPLTDPARYDPQRMAQDMGAVMDGLGIEQAIVGGESMGATTALLFALAHPERVKALLLTAPSLSQPAERERFSRMADAIESVGMEAFLKQAAKRQRDELGWSQAAIAAVARNFRSHDPSSVATACRAVMQWRTLSDLSPLSAFKKPVGLIGWPGDALHSLELAERMAAVFPQARLELLASLDAVFSRPALIGEVYLDFLRARESVNG